MDCFFSFPIIPYDSTSCIVIKYDVFTVCVLVKHPDLVQPISCGILCFVFHFSFWHVWSIASARGQEKSCCTTLFTLQSRFTGFRDGPPHLLSCGVSLMKPLCSAFYTNDSRNGECLRKKCQRNTRQIGFHIAHLAPSLLHFHMQRCNSNVVVNLPEMDKYGLHTQLLLTCQRCRISFTSGGLGRG